MSSHLLSTRRCLLKTRGLWKQILPDKVICRELSALSTNIKNETTNVYQQSSAYFRFQQKLNCDTPKLTRALKYTSTPVDRNLQCLHQYHIHSGLQGRTLHIHSTAVQNVYDPSVSVIMRAFHTSPRSQIPPFIWVVLQPIAKLTAIFTGRSLRKWWKSLPHHHRHMNKETLKKNWYWLLLVGVALSGMMYTYYQSHLQETPFTHRVRFIPVTDAQTEKISQEEANMILEQYGKACLPHSHPYYKLVTEVTRRIVSANQDIPKVKNHRWVVNVIDDEDQRNAFVLPTGHIFVFTGLLHTTQNLDQLAVVIGHEMAHTLLSHSAEQLSYMQLVDWMIIVVMGALWAFIPSDGIAVITQWFYHKIIGFSLHLPYSRKLEKEADSVGLHLCAKACFDVRESSAFWTIMDCVSRLENNKLPEWLSTHPSNENRVTHLNFLMPKAIEERKACSCQTLPTEDPRERVKEMVKATDFAVRALQTGINLKQVHVLKPRDPKSA